MSTPTVPPALNDRQPSTSPGHGLTIAAFLMPLAYLVWFWVMFALGYWVTDAMGAYPSTDRAMTDLGPGGWAVAIGFALLVALPSWIGIGLAVAARRRGAGTASLVGLGVNVVLAAGFVILSLVP